MEMGKMDQEELVLALQEIKLLQSLEHEHVLSYITCFQQEGYLCIVTEFCPNGDLSGEGFVLAIKMSLRKAVLLGLSFDLWTLWIACQVPVQYMSKTPSLYHSLLVDTWNEVL